MVTGGSTGIGADPPWFDTLYGQPTGAQFNENRNIEATTRFVGSNGSANVGASPATWYFQIYMVERLSSN